MTDFFFIVINLLMGACQVVSEVLSLNVTQMANHNLPIHVEYQSQKRCRTSHDLDLVTISKWTGA